MFRPQHAIAPSYVIDPTRIQEKGKEEESAILGLLLSAYKDEKFFNKNRLYPLQLKRSPSQHFETVYIQLTHSVIWRLRKSGNGCRYEVISNEPPLGSGGIAHVYKLSGTIVPLQNGKVSYKTNSIEKARIVKVQSIHTAVGEKGILTEYELTKQAGHLAVKPPTFSQEYGYTVMRYIQGETLYRLIIEDRKNKGTLIKDQDRLALTKAILHAVSTQVHQKGIVHRDLRPDNIMVDFSTNTPIVNMIDFGLSKSADKENDSKIVGANGFFSPEILTGKGTNFNSDVFSLAVVLDLLWGTRRPYIRPAYGMLGYVEDLNLYNKMQEIIQQMMDMDNAARPSITDILKMVDSIETEFNQKLKAGLLVKDKQLLQDDLIGAENKKLKEECNKLVVENKQFCDEIKRMQDVNNRIHEQILDHLDWKKRIQEVTKQLINKNMALRSEVGELSDSKKQMLEESLKCRAENKKLYDENLILKAKTKHPEMYSKQIQTENVLIQLDHKQIQTESILIFTDEKKMQTEEVLVQKPRQDMPTQLSSSLLVKQKMLKELDDYIAQRKDEAKAEGHEQDLSQNFHSLFARHLKGFNAKDKCDAAEKMKKLIMGEKVTFADRERQALMGHRLGAIINRYRFDGMTGEKILQKMRV